MYNSYPISASRNRGAERIDMKENESMNTSVGEEADFEASREAATRTGSSADDKESEKPTSSGWKIWLTVAVILVLILAALIAAMIFASTETVAKTKNIAIIVSAFSFILLLASLFILIFQLSALTSLLRVEVKPILKTTQDTFNNVKGTVSFMSDKVVEPAINAGAKVAGIKRITSIIFSKK